MVTQINKTSQLLSFSPAEEPYYSIRQRCEQMCHRFNHTPPASLKDKIQLLQALLNTESPVFIEPYFQCEYGKNIHLGCESFINHNVTIIDSASVTIGKNVLIGPNCLIDTVIKKEASKVYCSPIRIGNNVWIGANVTILSGVNIGNNAIIGAGCIVKHSVKSNEIVKNIK